VLVQKGLYNTFTAMSVWMTMSVISLRVELAHATILLVVIVVDALMATSLTQHYLSAYRYNQLTENLVILPAKCS
jgi:hypothetical protein